MGDIKKICVVTGSRAEYSLLYHTMKEILLSSRLKLQLLVTGMHLVKELGDTVRIIENDGFIINSEVDLGISGDSPFHISRAIGTGIIGFSEVYQNIKPDILLVLGDRYEIFAAVSAAVPFRIPVAHLSGGEITEGAIDEQLRHAITKMSHIHFPGTKPCADNIKRMGEESWRIFNVGEPGIENILKIKILDRDELFEQLSLDPARKTILATLHPTTLNSLEKEESEVNIFFSVLKEFIDCNIVVTYPNSDTHSQSIINKIETLKHLDNVKIFPNLGSLLYLNLMRNCDVVVGNSSSAIIEAPVLRIPVVNYGDRQKGRLMAENILECNADSLELKESLDKAIFDKKFKKKVQKTVSLYGQGNTSKKIVKTLESINLTQTLIRKKLVY